jgi:hypothetical protein
MSSGVLLVAFDSVTDQGNVLRYTELAKICANLVRKYLRLPVGIVSDVPIEGFDEQIVVEKPAADSRHVLLKNVHESYSWYNDYRRQLYNLTPFDRTLLLDVDYFLQSNQYLKCFEFDAPFQIVQNVYDPTGRNSFDKYAKLPNRTVPQQWATAMYWNRNASVHFEYANMIAENYEYYARVFGFSHKQYRNDMVFSIVSHMLPSYTMPWRMWMTSSDCKLTDASDSGLKFQYNNNVLRVDNDVHVLNKNIMTEDTLHKLQHWSSHAH